MKFLVLLLLTIIAFSNCDNYDDLKVLVKNFEAKIQSLLAAKNFDGLSKYLEDHMNFSVNEVEGGQKQDFINCLKNGTFVMFDGVAPKDIPEIEAYEENSQINVYRGFPGKRYVDYLIEKQNGTEFGYLLIHYFDYKSSAKF
ncbi:unnamed protein product [Caenorhabditis angaria]|uniref:DUF38 domain-containing protein n=1 Tax=Caenorhabditis angaria TaxID=860376 RepID=A0A9P1IEC3_9PELO|nr:unnamed protein product [Caenorhabditis angaria]